MDLTWQPEKGFPNKKRKNPLWLDILENLDLPQTRMEAVIGLRFEDLYARGIMRSTAKWSSSNCLYWYAQQTALTCPKQSHGWADEPCTKSSIHSDDKMDRLRRAV